MASYRVLGNASGSATRAAAAAVSLPFPDVDQPLVAVPASEVVAMRPRRLLDTTERMLRW